jgi:hypothetical protein
VREKVAFDVPVLSRDRVPRAHESELLHYLKNLNSVHKHKIPRQKAEHLLLNECCLGARLRFVHMQLFAPRKEFALNIIPVFPKFVLYGEFVGPRKYLLLDIQLHYDTSL